MMCIHTHTHIQVLHIYIYIKCEIKFYVTLSTRLRWMLVGIYFQRIYLAIYLVMWMKCFKTNSQWVKTDDRWRCIIIIKIEWVVFEWVKK